MPVVRVEKALKQWGERERHGWAEVGGGGGGGREREIDKIR